MTKLSDYAILLIGFSFSFLLINKIAFGASLILGIVLLILLNLEIVVKQSKRIFKKINRYEALITFFFLFFFVISAFLSIKPYRSFLVIIYLNLFIILSFCIFLILLENKKKAIFLFKILSISFAFNALLIFIYNISNYEFQELSKFKGFVNLMTIFAVVNCFLIKSKFNYITLILLIPNIIMSGSSASVLGIVIGICICFAVIFFKKFQVVTKFKYFVLAIFFTIPIFFSFLFYKSLPNKFDHYSITNFEFSIPTYLIDHHRQFIWGFSIQKFKLKPLFGYGQDSSNFIDGSQLDIGSKYTGDMNFIPSHPHNFLIEILLETGIFGTLFFILLIYVINYRVWKLHESLNFKLHLIFLNSYFWGSSLVNFSFWLGWWQASYFLLLSLIASKAFIYKIEK